MNEPTNKLMRDESHNICSWKQRAQRLNKEIRIFYFALKHPRVPWYARLVAACIAGYPLSPVQLIPSFIPVIGILDDLLILFLGAKLLNKIILLDVFNECRELANAAAMENEGRLWSPARGIAFAMVVAVWLLAAMGTSLIVATYVLR